MSTIPFPARPLRRRRPPVFEHWFWLTVCSLVIMASFSLEVRDTEYVGSGLGPNFVLPNLCMSRSVLGINCPGCGLTRSFIYLAHGDVLASWQMHRLGWALAAMVVFQVPYRIYRLARPRGWRLSYRMVCWLGFGFGFLLIGNWVLGWLLSVL